MHYDASVISSMKDGSNNTVVNGSTVATWNSLYNGYSVIQITFPNQRPTYLNSALLFNNSILYSGFANLAIPYMTIITVHNHTSVGNSGPVWDLQINNDKNKLYLTNIIYLGNSNGTWATSTVGLDYNANYITVARYNTNNTVSLFAKKNNEAITTPILNATYTPTLTFTNFQIGRRDPAEYWIGTVRELKVYRYAMTDLQVSNEINALHTKWNSIRFG
jgi:hypothetical protein